MIGFLKRGVAKWIYSADGSVFANRFRLTRSFRKGIKVSISYDGNLFWVEEGLERLAVARKSRLDYQVYGLSNRRRALEEEYNITSGLLRSGDTVIDCGANIGEFSLICAAQHANVIAFEPDRIDFAALKANALGKTIIPIQKALWKDTGEMEFFDNNNSGDSSLIGTGKVTNCYKVKTIRLDDVGELPSTRIRLIKLEAEGAEPEILEGMKKTLERTDLITVDMGPERGAANQCTVAECTTILYESGFRMRAFSYPRITALFEKVI